MALFQIGQRVAVPGADGLYYLGIIKKVTNTGVAIRTDKADGMSARLDQVIPVMMWKRTTRGIKKADLVRYEGPSMKWWSDRTHSGVCDNVLLGMWLFVNHVVFEGRLKKIPIKYESTRKFARKNIMTNRSDRGVGLFVSDSLGNETIYIDPGSLQNAKEVMECMAHEMSHQAVFEIDYDSNFFDYKEEDGSGHGEQFMKWTRKVQSMTQINPGRQYHADEEVQLYPGGTPGKKELEDPHYIVALWDGVQYYAGYLEDYIRATQMVALFRHHAEEITLYETTKPGVLSEVGKARWRGEGPRGQSKNQLKRVGKNVIEFLNREAEPSVGFKPLNVTLR